MTKKGNKAVVELQLNSSAPISERELRKGFELPKTQQSLCAIENSAILESDVRADASPSDKAEALKLAREWHQKNLFVQVGLNPK